MQYSIQNDLTGVEAVPEAAMGTKDLATGRVAATVVNNTRAATLQDLITDPRGWIR